MKVIRSLIIFVGLGLTLSSPCYSAEPGTHQEDFRETPKPFRLLADQWSAYPSLSEAYSLEFLRTADRETAQMTLKEAIFVGLKNNPGIEVDRLEPLRAAEQTQIEKSIFDPTLNLEFHKDYAVDPYGPPAHFFSRFKPARTAITTWRSENFSSPALNLKSPFSTLCSSGVCPTKCSSRNIGRAWAFR